MYRWRYRTVSSLYALPPQSAHRRNSSQHLARRYAEGMRIAEHSFDLNKSAFHSLVTINLTPHDVFLKHVGSFVVHWRNLLVEGNLKKQSACSALTNMVRIVYECWMLRKIYLYGVLLQDRGCGKTCVFATPSIMIMIEY